MARPEGYRKAVRLMDMADHFGIPVIALIDTAGAYPGIGAEERGQAEAIARSTEACLRIGVPNVAVIIGEGGSGGAIAIATANRVIMLEHAIYSVISPEGAASILWRDTAKAQEAASNMKITAQDLVRFGVVDTIVPEPTGGAHRDPAASHRRDRRGARRGLCRAQGPRRGNDRAHAAREIHGHRADPRLTRQQQRSICVSASHSHVAIYAPKGQHVRVRTRFPPHFSLNIDGIGRIYRNINQSLTDAVLLLASGAPVNLRNGLRKDNDW